ncbi:MAG: 2'-5' RNA ligase family protein [Anaerolineae bacterium]|nr:2'-5' RNA ligase family protein [Anaerolineae bacterium]
MNKVGIICLLSKEVQKYQRELRQKIAAQFELDGVANPVIPAHITIKYPFPVENLDEIEQAVQEFSIFQSKAKWLLQDFNSFKNGDNYVVFIDVIASEEIRKVHARFLSRLRKINWVQWGQFDNSSLHYHVTLGAQGITSGNFEAIWSFINQQKKPNFKAFFDNISLVRINEYTRYVYKTYRFQNYKAG